MHGEQGELPALSL